jgi:hypothetical protein
MTVAEDTSIIKIKTDNTMMYWENASNNMESESKSEEEDGKHWEAVKKKTKKNKRLKKVITDMHEKKNDIKHAWIEGNKSTMLQGNITKTKENDQHQSTVSNIEKYHHSKRAAKIKTSNSKDLITHMMGIENKTNSTVVKEHTHTTNKETTEEKGWDISKLKILNQTTKLKKIEDITMIGDKQKIPEEDGYDNNNKIIALTNVAENKTVDNSENVEMDYSLEKENKEKESSIGKEKMTLEKSPSQHQNDHRLV